VPVEALDKMFARTLSDDYESDTSWEAVRALHKLGTQEVFEQAAAWCASQDPMKRARSADILGQIGETSEHPGNSF
jgi:HEAT repeat protein